MSKVHSHFSGPLVRIPVTVYLCTNTVSAMYILDQMVSATYYYVEKSAIIAAMNYSGSDIRNITPEDIVGFDTLCTNIVEAAMDATPTIRIGVKHEVRARMWLQTPAPLFSLTAFIVERSDIRLRMDYVDDDLFCWIKAIYAISY